MHDPILVVATIWWILFCSAVGLTLGSYLNVVIYRVPRGISTSLPRWSFCPGCESRIPWYDNLPVLSYLRLGGRCRKCGGVIAPRYPIVELLTATVALVLLDTFCIARLRAGLHPALLGLTEQLSFDWPIVLAHIILFVCLLGMSVIDLEHYFIDIRFTDFAVLAGFVLHALWTPFASNEWHRPGVTSSAVSGAAIAGLGLTWLVLRLVYPPRDRGEGEGERGRQGDKETERPGDRQDACLTQPESAALNPQSSVLRPPSSLPDPQAPTPSLLAPDLRPHYSAVTAFNDRQDACPTKSSPSRIGVWLAGLLFLGILAVLGVDTFSPDPTLSPTSRLLVPLIAFFGFVVAGSAPLRDSDTEIVDSIDAERTSARSVALQELLLLGPAIALGAVALWLCVKNPSFRGWIEDGMRWPAGTWRPLLGLSTAAAGYVIGGAIGWGVRILFTLLLGREAFGTGDIHLMAAAGCVAGWPVVVLGFFLACFLALAGWVATLPFKRTRAIPLVPWLSLAFLAVVVFLEPIIASGPVRNLLTLVELLSNNSQAG